MLSKKGIVRIKISSQQPLRDSEPKEASIITFPTPSWLRVMWDSPHANEIEGISTANWEPIWLECINGSNTRREWLHCYTNFAAWNKIHRAVNKLSWEKNRNFSYLSGRQVKEGEDEIGRFKVIKGRKTYHKAIEEVIEKLDDAFNAVAITPDSWLDKKLQEAYYSKRNNRQGKMDDEGS